MKLKSRFITSEEFFELTGDRLENRVISSDNPSNDVDIFLKRANMIIETYFESRFYYQSSTAYDRFNDEQKARYKQAIAEQILYMLANGDLSLDSAYLKESGLKANRREINTIRISPVAYDIFVILGLASSHIKRGM